MRIRVFKKSVYRLALFLIISVFFSACKQYYSQVPEDLFTSGKLPILLDQLANPTPNSAQLKIILEKDRSGMFLVGNIDGGMDPFNDILLEQTDWQVENGRVVGFGTDIMGGDYWPHPAVVDPSLFAFGAEDLDEDEKIFNEHPDPLDLITRINERFMELLLGEIKKREALKDSAFGFLNPSNFSIFGASQILISLSDEPFNQSQYEAKISKGQIKRPSELWEAYKKSVGLSHVDSVTKLFTLLGPWNAMDSNGLPSVGFMNYFSAIPDARVNDLFGAPDFIEILQNVFDRVDQEFAFSDAFGVYLKFLRSNMRLTKSDPDSTQRKAALKQIQEDWYKEYTSYAKADPMRSILNLIAQEVDAATWEKIVKGEAGFDILGDPEEIIANRYERLRKLYTLIKESSDFSRAEQVLAKENLEALDEVKELALSFINERGLGDFERILDEDFNSTSLTGREAYLEMGKRLNTPYLASNSKVEDYGAGEVKSEGGVYLGSNTRSHGTHTAATTAWYNSKILIHPVRVITSGKSSTMQYKLALAKKFEIYFEDWIQNNAVLQGLSDLLKPFLEVGFSIEDVRLLDANQTRKLRAELKKVIGLKLLEKAEKSSMNMEFFEQMLKSIETLGEKKIPVANVSLGTDFDQPPAIPNTEDKKQLLDNAFEFIQFELFKFLIATRLSEKAPGTTLFVASGNDGFWLDSRSKSDLPAIIYSPYFKDYEDRGYSPVSNNHTKNILVVGSLQPDKTNLSSFTNVVLRNGIPFVFGVGEAVEAPIQLADPSGAAVDFNKTYLSDLEPIHLPGELSLSELYLSIGEADPLKGLDDIERAQTEVRLRKETESLLTFFNTGIRKALKVDHCVHSVICSVEYNGTSMATPNVLGEYLDWKIKSLDTQGLSWSPELYNTPGFRPEDVISEVMQISRPLDETLNIRARRLTNTQSMPFRPIKTPMIESSSKLSCKAILL